MNQPSGSNVLKPQPRVNELTRPFWEGANSRKLMIQRCARPECGKAVFYPRVCCPFCKGAQLNWIQASGNGSVISHTTVRRTHHDGFNSEAPYVFAAIELDEGPCIYAQVPGAPLEASLIGQKVGADFVEHGPNRLMPVFKLSSAA